MADNTPPPQPTEQEQERLNGTANMLAHAADAAAAADAGETHAERETAPASPQKTPSFPISDHNRASNRPAALSADSYYQHQTGIDTGEAERPIVPVEHDEEAPPAYTNTLGHIADENLGLGTNAVVAEDGRVNIRIDQTSHKLSALLVPALRNQRQIIADQQPPPPPYIPVSLGGSPGELPPPPLNVVIHVVGSRGDVQPFVALGKVLKETYNHRVRLATHPVFKTFVEENGLEFFSIGGDPAELMAFMVKNPGLMPGFDTLRNGDVGKRRANIAEMISGCWRSCIEAGDGSGVEASDDAIGDWTTDEVNDITVDEATARPFVADCIIANPPSFAHIHCAERLGIPLHMMFTMPWSPTEAFPHPLTNIESSNADATLSNYISYALVDMLTWQGLGDVINRFRVHSLGLEPVSMVWAPGMLARLRVPYTYCWSPALIPKPADWGAHISISGFYFLSLASNYTPDPELLAFLQAGPPPVYIGFGSIVVDDPNAMTQMIFEAVKKTGQRALVSKGWGGLGADQLGIPEGVFMLGNVPHDWLFTQVSCVVHHGGAGTTAAGISAGRPTVVVPFFGDQPFWGAMVARAGAGPVPTPYKKLTADILAESILEALKPTSLERAKELSAKISKEKGSDKGAQCFHQMLNVDKMRCSILPEHAAVWRVKRTQIRLSALAAYVLAEKEVISFADLKLFRPREYEVEEGPTDPITGGAGAVVGTMTSMMMGIADFPVATLKALAIHPDADKKKKSKKDKDKDGKDGKDSAESSSSAAASSSNLAMSSTASRTSLDNRTLASSSGASRGSLDKGTPPTTPGSSSVAKTESFTAEPEELSQESTQGSDVSTVTSPADVSRVTSPRGGALAEAMRSLPEHSRPRSPSRNRSPSRHGSQTHRHFSQSSSKPDKPEHTHSWSEINNGPNALDTAFGTGKGLSKIVGAGLKSPMDLLLGVSKGFHNMPKLYGEEVRETGRVTGMKSGLRTAGKEFSLGMYDGISGLVTQPLSGAKKEGAAGFVKGFGRGIAGLILKPAAGAYALPGYAMKGIYKEIQKTFGASVNNYIIAARTAQGWEAWLRTDKEYQTKIVKWYLQVSEEAKKKKNVGEDQYDAVSGFIEKRQELRKERWAKAMTAYKGKKKELSDSVKGFCPPSCPIMGKHSHSTSDLLKSDLFNKKQRTGIASGDSTPRPSLSMSNGNSLEHASTYPLASGGLGATKGISEATPHYHDEDDHDHDHDHSDQHALDLEKAIQQSIAESSTGDIEEDRAIARAIQASIAELHRSGMPAHEPTAEEDEETQLRLALQESMIHDHMSKELGDDPDVLHIAGSHDSHGDDEAQHALPNNDEDLQRAIEESKKLAVGGDSAAKDEDLTKAIEESKKHTDEEEKARREEEIVMEYIKKQSLAEEEHRRRIVQGRETDGSASGTSGGASAS